MNGLASLERATLMGRRSAQQELSGSIVTREDLDFRRETVVAFDIGVDGLGQYVDPRTGQSRQPVVETFSRMKYGDLDAVNFFAGHVASAAMQSEWFLGFCQRAQAAGRFTYILSTAMFNVPSASNLLARTTADCLNIGLATLGLPPVIKIDQTRLTESPLGYARKTLQERANAPIDGSPGSITIVPDQVRGQSVIFLDDLFNSGYSANRSKSRLQNIGVADTFSLFAAMVDPDTVAATDGTIEFHLNNEVIDGSLESIAPMLHHGNFAVVQKLMKITMDPAITEQLPAFLRDIPTASILKLFSAAASNDYRRRYDRQFVPSLAIYEAELQERGVLDGSGCYVATPASCAKLRP